MNREMNLCNSDPDKRIPHELIVVKWKFGDNGKTNTYKHATQLLCVKCFNLFDFQAISDFHVAGLCKCQEISSGHSCQNNQPDIMETIDENIISEQSL